jgi:hypothetical protein
LRPDRLFFWKRAKMKDRIVIFRQINTNRRCTHHDALEFPDGRIVLLTTLCEGRAATVLPAQPATGAETGEQNFVTWLNELLPQVSLAVPYRTISCPIGYEEVRDSILGLMIPWTEPQPGIIYGHADH